MMTRSGRGYQKLGPEAGVRSVDLNQVLQAFIEGRKSCKKDLVEKEE